MFVEDQKDKGFAHDAFLQQQVQQEPVEEDNKTLHETFLTGPTHAKKATNREGNEVSAIRNAQNNFNYHNGKSKGKFRRKRRKRAEEMLQLWLTGPSGTPV